jgi:hypothetical protein
MVDLQWIFLTIFFVLLVKCQQQPIPTSISNTTTSIASSKSSDTTSAGNKKRQKFVDRLLYTYIKEMY